MSCSRENTAITFPFLTKKTGFRGKKYYIQSALLGGGGWGGVFFSCLCNTLIFKKLQNLMYLVLHLEEKDERHTLIWKLKIPFFKNK